MGLRILVSDYSGHPFQVQLSRELARRGHEVIHSYSAGFQTPKGNLAIGDGRRGHDGAQVVGPIKTLERSINHPEIRRHIFGADD